MKNILDVTDGIICQQVNCKGVMGAGLALQIRNKYPTVYDAYRKYYKKGLLDLGVVFMVPVSSTLIVANLCGQYGYGRDKQYTDYYALMDCFSFLQTSRRGKNIYIPYKMGCRLGGGDWKKVNHIIKQYLPDAIIVGEDETS
jgi:O-acetyl-ADP-ribose deacetylase (regulator of RNase III)